MPKHWRFALHDRAHVQTLCGTLKVSPLLAQVLVARGHHTAEDAEAFLNTKLGDLHDPSLLPGIDHAASLVVEAVQQKRPIVIYGDYDVDGVTSVTLLWHCLRLAGANVDFYIPDRMDEGYGLNDEALKTIHAGNPNTLVVTVDCGISALTQAELARKIGLKLIITDHHTMKDTLPPAECLVHPRLPGSEYPFPDLCGVGVAFKLAWAICQKLGDGQKASAQMREFLMSAVGLAAIGTIADVVPLTGENRIIVRYGLSSLAHRSSLGLQALMKSMNIDISRPLSASDIGFGLAPRINAAGRLQQARLAVELLTTNDPARATMLAAHLDYLNKERQTIERRILKQAKEMVEENGWQDDPALVLCHEKWHQGVIGIVASRVAEHFEKPTILISLDAASRCGQGSGRTYGSFDLHKALCECSHHLITFGGHRAAAGLKIQADQLEQFREGFNTFMDNFHEPVPEDSELKIDAEVRLADVTLRAVQELDRLGPFGQCNPDPVFAATHVQLAGPPQRMGEGQNHLNVRFRQFGTTMRAISWGRGDWAEELSEVSGPISICFSPLVNEFRGQRNVELRLIDWKPADRDSLPSSEVLDSATG